MFELKNISKSFSDGSGLTINLLKNISFSLPDNKICSIVGQSGSGKTSLLKIIAGLEIPSGGEIINGNNSVLLFIPSEPSSFPWLNVKENILFGLNNTDNNNIEELIKIVGLEGYESHFPHNKSLGFRFRISLARTIIRKPNLIVMDEPFNKMNEETKEELYILLRNINNTLKIPIILGTSNINEAIFLSDKLFLMKNKPGEVFKSMDINLPEKRDSEMFLSEDFNKTRMAVENSYISFESKTIFNISI
jgi:ABC-type nitrate/sulfonate/bicarbonate transport system ATPase subunit